jgi:predicted metal-dependent hydrolase
VLDAGGGRRRSAVTAIEGDDDATLLIRLVSRDQGTLERPLEAWFRARAREAIQESIDRHAPELGVRPAAITIRDQRSRWGSASRAGRLSFSWRLILGPPDALDTVVVHELAHLRVFGHGPRFWALVASRRPDHLVWRRWLRDHALELRATLGPPRGQLEEPSIA